MHNYNRQDLLRAMCIAGAPFTAPSQCRINDNEDNEVFQVLIPQPNLSRKAQQWNQHQLELAERIYTELFLHFHNKDVEAMYEGPMAIDEYIIDNDYFGILPLDNCYCRHCQVCNTCKTWTRDAHDITYEVIDGFTSPMQPIVPKEHSTVRILVPNVVVVTAALGENPYLRNFNAGINRPPFKYC